VNFCHLFISQKLYSKKKKLFGRCREGRILGIPFPVNVSLAFNLKKKNLKERPTVY